MVVSLLIKRSLIPHSTSVLPIVNVLAVGVLETRLLTLSLEHLHALDSRSLKVPARLRSPTQKCSQNNTEPFSLSGGVFDVWC